MTSSGTITEDGILLVEDTALDRPEFEKKIKDTNDTTGETSDWQDSADYDIGDSVPYKLTATLAKDVTEYWKYHVTFHDKMEESLTFEQIDSVKLNGTQLDAADYIFNKISDQEFSLTVEFGDGTGKITDTSLNGAKVDVYFSAKLNDKAALGKQGNVNTAKLEYSFNPNLVDDGEGGKKPSEDTEETEEDFVIAFTYQVDINKVDEEGKVLTGAEFKLEKKLPGDILKEIGSITAENGATFSFKGLDDGTYVLTETKAPAKYLSIDPIEFTVTAVHAAEWTDQAKRLEVLSELTGDVKDGVLTLNADDDLAKLTGDVADELTHIEVSKVDIADGEELEGAHVQVLRKATEEELADENTEYADIKNKLIQVEEWISTKEAHVIEGLLTNTDYILRETVAPDGYTVTTDIGFTIDETGKITTTGSTTTDEKGNTIILIEDAKTHVEVSKVDIADGKEIPGATIQILREATDEEKADENTEYADEVRKLVIVEEWTSTEEAHEIEGLLTNTEYILKETVAPDGYTIATETTFTIDEQGKVTSTGTVTEDGILLVEDAKTHIEVSKVDIADGEELPGATIQILREVKDGEEKDNSKVYVEIEGKTYEVVDEWISEKDSTHVIEGLLTNTEYILRETVAPNGYDIATDTTFTIDELGNVTSTGSVTEDGILLVEDAMFRVSAAVKKVWNDGNNQDGVRPLTVRVNLLANGAKIDSVVLSMANGWMAVINDLPMVDGEQKDIEYTWAEEAPGNGYTLTSQEKKGTLTTITNSLPPETTGLSVQKIWEDDGNAHQTRPNEIKVQLYADGKACGEAVVLNAANSWKTEWTGLDKFVNEDCQTGHAKEIIYTVEELEVPEGYQATVSGNAKTGYVIRNVLERGRLIIEKSFQFGEIEPDEPDNTPMDIPVTKTWNDNGNKDGNRPASITVRLLADGTEVASAELTAAGGWGTVFTDLPRYNGEEKIHYTITEDPVTWYTAEINGFNIRNNYVPEVTSATVRKVWDDNNNAEKMRPSSIHVTLSNGTNNNAEKMRPSSIHVTLSNGTTVLLSEENGWTATINNLPTRVNGQPVTYTWTEQTVIAYKQSKVEQQGNTTIFTNSFTQIPKVPDLPKKPTVPDGTWERFEEYDTPLGVQTIINHVGDCFD